MRGSICYSDCITYRLVGASLHQSMFSTAQGLGFINTLHIYIDIILALFMVIITIHLVIITIVYCSSQKIILTAHVSHLRLKGKVEFGSIGARRTDQQRYCKPTNFHVLLIFAIFAFVKICEI